MPDQEQSMKVTVFGATGKIGRLVVEQLLDHQHDPHQWTEHEVTAYVRDPAKPALTHPRLTVVTGQLSDAAAVASAVKDADAVISALGPSLRRGATGRPVTQGTQTIVAAMTSAGVRRFVGLATPSVPDPQDRPTIRARVLPVLAGMMFPNALHELVGMTDAVTGSDLDWTIARITNPTDRPAKGSLRAGFLGRDPVGSSMTRADIAAFLIGQLTDTQYLRSLPAISN
jgi:nucleoside-diphosphate-sugar epimerase